MWAHGAMYAAMGKVGMYPSIWGVTFVILSFAWASDVWHRLWILYIPRLPVTSGFCGAGKVVSGIVFTLGFCNKGCLLNHDTSDVIVPCDVAHYEKRPFSQILGKRVVKDSSRSTCTTV
jgi:hypothetical protein